VAVLVELEAQALLVAGPEETFMAGPNVTAPPEFLSKTRCPPPPATPAAATSGGGAAALAVADAGIT